MQIEEYSVVAAISVWIVEAGSILTATVTRVVTAMLANRMAECQMCQISGLTCNTQPNSTHTVSVCLCFNVSLWCVCVGLGWGAGVEGVGVSVHIEEYSAVAAIRVWIVEAWRILTATAASVVTAMLAS